MHLWADIKMKYILTIIFGIFITIGLCCDCQTSLMEPFQKAEYEKWGLISLVKIGQEIKPGVFEIKVIENFKGKITSTTKIINGDYCSYSVKTGQKWIVYSEYGDETDTIIVDECSRSRDIEKTKYWVPPPPMADYHEENKEKYRIAYDKYVKSDRGDIADELIKLRELKTNAR